MKINLSLLVIAAMLPVAGLALAAPTIKPATGDEASGFSGTPSQQRERQAEVAQIDDLDDDAVAAMNAGQYAAAEEDARQSIAIGPDSGVAQDVLAASLYTQGKMQEALEVYKAIDDENDAFPHNQLPYAQLLLQTGHWKQAVAAYNKALRLLDFGDLVRANSNFSPDVPQPTELAAAIQVGMGLTMSGGDFHGTYQARTQQAMSHFQKALALEPDNALVNYYYGYGWRKLSPTDQTKFRDAQQAKAALQKAATAGSPSVKKAAKKAMRIAANP